MNFSPQLPFDFSASEKYTFDNFLVSAKNSELVNLLTSFDRLEETVAFVWGTTGVGKSHLLQALCNENEVNESLQSLYLPMQKIKVFGPDVFASLHHMELICIDDFDLVVRDKAWEESLFEFFNRSREAGVKLLVSSDKSPRGLDFALPDLASRMSWGVIYRLHELSDDEKLLALDARAADKHMPLSSDVLNYIFQRHSRDLQSLLEVLNRLDELSLAEKRRLTIPFVRQVMDWS
jgi:DnaA family protein